MSTLSGTASKGEKTKPKFQCLDINSLYRTSRGESTETKTQKSSSIYIKHGMQSLGKVPSARRAPANLPSLKAEHGGGGSTSNSGGGSNNSSGGGATSSPSAAVGSAESAGGQSAAAGSSGGGAVPRGPTGAAGWGGAKQQEGGANAAAAAGQTTNGPMPGAVAAAQQQHKQTTHSSQAAPSGGDKLWSSVTLGHQSTDHHGHHHPQSAAALFHSPQFQHEFPRLSGAGGGSGGNAAGGQAATAGAGPSLSLRPQTEGSWTQGGQRVGGAGQQVQQQQQPPGPPLPPQVRGVLPQFMFKGSMAAQSGVGTQNQNNVQSQQPPPQLNGRERRNMNRPPRLDRSERDLLPEELTPRPIIREEELNKLDEISQDMGWAVSDDIDYNQKLAFSDDECDKPVKKTANKSQESRNDRQTPPSKWSSNRNSRGRSSDDEDNRIMQKRQDKEVELAIQRAKQRREEEEKRIEETKQRAQQKLRELDEKKRERDRENETSHAPPKNNHSDTQGEKERERDTRSRTPNDTKEEASNTFRQMTQIESKTFPRNQKKPERDHRGEQSGPYWKQFQNNLPPRFQQQRHNSNSNVQSNSNYPFSSSRWASAGQNPPKPQSAPLNRNMGSSERMDDDNKRDYKRQSSDESYRSSYDQHKPDSRYSDDSHSYDSYNKSDSKEDKWQHDKDRLDKKDEEWNLDKRQPQEKSKDRYDKDRPDSRDSHSTKRSRDSEPRDYGIVSWSESVETQYEEKWTPHREERDRRVVPGPITRDRIEADDGHEKRNLTQLKKGEILKKNDRKDDKHDETSNDKFSSAWGDSMPSSEDTVQDKKNESTKQDNKHERKQDESKNQNRGRNYSQNKSWNSNSSDYHSRNTAWSNKRPSSRGYKGQGAKSDYHPTDSDGSLEEHHAFEKDKQNKKSEKDERNKQEKQNQEKKQENKDNKKDDKKDAYIPRGEPSRHGRGGGANFRGNRMGGMSKRIDGYGPPPSKSPFGHHDDKEKKNAEDASSETNAGGSNASTMDKTKQNQEALAAGIIGKNRQEERNEKNKGRSDSRRNKSKSRKEDHVDSNSENSDESKKNSSRSSKTSSSRSRNNPSRTGDKRSYDQNKTDNSVSRQNSGSTLKKDDRQDPNSLANSVNEMSLKDDVNTEKNDEKEPNGDSEGFQEVKSKKTGKERQKPEEKKFVKNEHKDKLERKPSKTQNLTQQQIQNIPPLMATPVNPPQVLPQPKSAYDNRPRLPKLAPRFAKQKLQKQYQQQQQQQNQIMGGQEINELNKMSINAYSMKEGAIVSTSVTACAWDKPLSSQLRGVEDNMLGVSIDGMKGLDTVQSPTQQSASPSSDKILGKSPQLTDKALLDGTTAPVNTIIFENTNFKSAPGSRSNRNDKPRSKIDEGAIDNSVMSGFNKPINDLLQSKNDKNEPIQLPLFKEDSSDMKLDFFGSDLSHLTDDKSSKNICMSKSMHTMSSGNNTICNADSLNMKIASVKKVWETSEQEGEDNSNITFGSTGLDSNMFKGNDTGDDQHEGYSPSASQAVSTSTNVCKVKPTQQVSGSTGPTVLNSAQQQHQQAAAQHGAGVMTAAGLIGNPLSPPPPQIQPAAAAAAAVLGAAQYAAHVGYQGAPAAAGQYGVSAIPSPPTVLYNSAAATQQLQGAAAGLYGAAAAAAAALQIDQSGVLGGQGRSQFSQFPNYPGLGQAASSPYSMQSMFLQTAHPPPTAQAPPELYPSMNSYRLSAAAAAATAQPFGQTQQLSNPSTVLISTTSSSLMSAASVKPSNQPISAIGTKAGGVGQAYQQQSQQGQQVYMTYDPSMQANYLSSASVMQRTPAAPVQNSVVPAALQSSSYYSGSTGSQTAQQYFQQAAAAAAAGSTLQSQLAQAAPPTAGGFSLQGSVFSAGPPPTAAAQTAPGHTSGLQGYGSHFLSAPMQMAAAMSAQQQQYRSGLGNPYVKGVGGQPLAGADQTTRQQQLKSPAGQEAVLSSVFNTGWFLGPQIPSPKSRQNNNKQPQSSPTSQRKYNLYQGMGNQGNVQQRYPTPIQRPVNFQQNLGSVQQNNMNNQKHNRSNNPNKTSNNRQYYSQNNTLSPQTEKVDETKVSEAKKAVSPANVVNSTSEIVKEVKEETTTLKD